MLINRRSYFEHCPYFQRHSLWPCVRCLWPSFRDQLYFLPDREGGGTTWFLAEQNGGSVESHGNKTRLCWSSGEVTSNIAPVFGDFNCGLVTAFYRDQSLFIAWGWRAGDLRGGHLTFRRTKGGISRNWEAQMGDCCKLWKDSEEEPLKFA